MPVYINTNISSLNAQRQLGKAGMEMDTAMERLSSGKRITSAKDDAAGLAISNRQTSQIRGLDQAVRNANDGISMIQTAEGALEESTNILQRMRELSVQSANGIYGDADRATLDAEVQQLVAELDRIAESTTFNGQNILDGSVGKVDLQVGAYSDETIGFEMQAVDADTLGMGSLSADVIGDEISATISTNALEEQDILINGQAIGAWASTDTLEDLVDNINENVNGVTASTVVELNGSTVGTGVTGSTASVITVTKNDGNTLVINITDTNSIEEYAAAVKAESGGLISASVNDKGQLSLSAQDARTIALTGTNETGIGDTTDQARIILTSDNGDDITIERGGTGTTANLTALGFRESRDAGTIQGVGLAQNSGGANEKLVVGELTINGVEIGIDDTSSLAGKIEAINDVSDQTGVTANAFASLTIDLTGYIGSAQTAAKDNIKVNGVSIDLGLAVSATAQDIVDGFNAETDTTGVTARVLGENIVLESDEGAIRIQGASTAALTMIGTTTGFDTFTTTLVVSNTSLEALSTTTLTSATAITTGGGFTAYAGLKLVSDNGNPISIELSDDSDMARLGLKEANTLGEGSFGSAISSISIDTANNAQDAIDVIDNALDTVNDLRSSLGAVNNRLDFTISNLGNASENASAARSRIVDADFASETANLSRAQVLQQASQAMLAQANARPQQVLSLLQ